MFVSSAGFAITIYICFAE